MSADDRIRRETRQNPDGSRTETVSFRVDSDSVRPVRDDVVEALDAALSAHGEVLHGIDPARMVRFDHGGPPVWSVASVVVGGPRPYHLFLTYGFSGTLTPVPYREPYALEYSVAVPVGTPKAEIWGPALLRHLTRYVLQSGAELCVGDNMPLPCAVSRVPFAPQHHAEFPDSALSMLLVAPDPLLGSVDTPHGPVEVRRFYGLGPEEASLVEVWSSTSFLDEARRADPDLLMDLDRASLLSDAAFRARCDERARAEGGSVGHLFVEGGWSEEGSDVLVHFPGGSQAQQIRRVLAARLPYGRPLYLRDPRGAGPLAFIPEDTFSMRWEGDMLVFAGSLDHEPMRGILAALDPAGPGATLRVGGG